MSQEDKLIRIRQKSDTAENWILNNPVLLYGELGLEIDTQKIKMGDGVTPWTGLRYVMQDVADNMNNKANTDLSNVSALTTTVKDTLGVATKSHASSSTGYGTGTTSNYGHVRTGGFSGNGHYVQSRRSAASLSNFNSTTYLYPGEFPISFYINATNAPSTISNDTGITSTSTYIYGIIKTDNYYTGNYSTNYGVKQTLIIPKFNVAYERCCYQGSSTYGTWEKIGNFEMPEDIECEFLMVNSGAHVANLYSDGEIHAEDCLISALDIKGKGNWRLSGYEPASGDLTLYAEGPLAAPYYVGTFQTEWYFDEWHNGYPPYLSLYKEEAPFGKECYLDGSLTDIFPPSQYDIIITLDDTTLQYYYSQIAEIGLWVGADGCMHAKDWDLVYDLLYGVDLGINVTVYYTGGGVL